MVRPYKVGKWITKDFKELAIKDMDTSHIINTIRYLEKHKGFYDEYCFVGFTCDGDGDGQIYESIDNEKLVNQKIAELKEELFKRKIAS